MRFSAFTSSILIQNRHLCDRRPSNGSKFADACKLPDLSHSSRQRYYLAAHGYSTSRPSKTSKYAGRHG